MDTFVLANGRQWDDSPTMAVDDIKTDTSTLETETGLHLRDVPVPVTPTSLTAVGAPSETMSAELTAAEIHLLESLPPPSAEPASNPDPTKPTRLDPGFIHLVAGTFVDAYEIEKLLGSGGMGAVYGARHEKLGRRVAIKVIAPALSRDRSAVERFEQEAQALARLSHPNIVGVLAVGTLPGDERSYFVMEWLDGESLQARLDRGRIPLDEALDLVDQIARGLEAAHSAGIVHRDLKPDNVWLQRLDREARPIVKILDFGLSKLSEHRRSEETATNVMFGTPQFMSPEQCRSSRDVGAATDVYALGCVMFDLLGGRLPFTYKNVVELIVAHQSEVPPRLRDLNVGIDSQLDELLVAMLAKDPAQRPSLAAVRSTIDGARERLAFFAQRAPARTVSTSTIVAPHVVAAPSASTPHSRRGIVLAIAAALLLLSVVLITTLATRSHRDEHRTDQVATVRIDASVTTSASPPVNAPMVPVESADASVVAQQQPPKALETRAVAPVVHEVSVDAGIAASIDADAAAAVMVELDAGMVEEEQRTRPVSVSKVPEPQVHHPTSHPETKRPKLDKKQTFNPFTGEPSSR